MKKRAPVRVAAVQAAPVFLDREGSTAHAIDYIEQAGQRGLDLIVFPEGFIPAHPVWYHFIPATSRKALDMAARLFENSVEIPGPMTDGLCAAARAAGVNVVIGVCERRPNTSGTMYNTQLFIDRNGQIVGKHQKLMPTVGERLVHTGGWGDTLHAVDFGPVRVSGLICGENSNPLAIFSLSTESAQVHAASWPNHFSKSEHAMADVVLLASRSLAYKANCFVINACGTVSAQMIEEIATSDSDREFLRAPQNSGGSSIIDANAMVIAGPIPGNQEGFLEAELDLGLCVHSKLVHDYSGHYNRPDIFTLRVSRRVPDYVENSDEGAAAAEGAAAGPTAKPGYRSGRQPAQTAKVSR
jgi:aliphatic nitrilase